MAKVKKWQKYKLASVGVAQEQESEELRGCWAD